TTEAILSAVKEYGDSIEIDNLPVTLAITNLYEHRSQTLNYTHSRKWNIGLKLFLSDLGILCGEDSPFAKLRVMVHLDHISPVLDKELLGWDMNLFSSIMFDASAMPFQENMKATAKFVSAHGREIVIEGACDEIVDAGGNEVSRLTSPENAEEYMSRTKADFMVANLGTEHRASAADLKYHGDIARRISGKIGKKIVLHGCSSVSAEQIRKLFDDGVCKVNIWTALERDSVPALLRDMTANAGKVAGQAHAKKLLQERILGEKADAASKASLGYFTTSYRQGIIFEEMKKVVKGYLGLWYV
ncbi:MAG: class II fructose-bisphosphate aldolase, partial [Lentisphaerae bacterium]|nr:class II fructose-bisphosphate aldolase [Lentisphaerota bacterium]